MARRWALSGGPGAWLRPPSRCRGRGAAGELPGTHEGMARPPASSRLPAVLRRGRAPASTALHKGCVRAWRGSCTCPALPGGFGPFPHLPGGSRVGQVPEGLLHLTNQLMFSEISSGRNRVAPGRVLPPLSATTYALLTPFKHPQGTASPWELSDQAPKVVFYMGRIRPCTKHTLFLAFLLKSPDLCQTAPERSCSRGRAATHQARGAGSAPRLNTSAHRAASTRLLLLPASSLARTGLLHLGRNEKAILLAAHRGASSRTRQSHHPSLLHRAVISNFYVAMSP